MWDLSVERDEEAVAVEHRLGLNDLPPQLLFLHEVCVCCV